MYKINFNHLYYFLVIAREGSIVKAAKKLHITQPALSHQLKSLEDDLGRKLFDRVGRRLALNKQGELVLEHASRIFRQSEEMINLLKGKGESRVRIIKVGAVPWLPKDQVLNFIKPLLSSRFFQVHAYEASLEGLIKQVLEKSIDVLLCDSPYAGRSKKLIASKLLTGKIVCVASKSFKGIKRKQFPKCLEGHKVINYSESCFLRESVDSFLDALDVPVFQSAEFNDVSLVRLAVEKGVGIGFLPENAAKEPIRQKQLVKLGELPNSNSDTWAITLKEGRQHSTIQELITKQRKKIKKESKLGKSESRKV